MREMLVIAKRELLERVRTKWFVIMTVIGPILMIALIVIPALLSTRGVSGAKVQIVDQSGALGAPLVTRLSGPPLLWKAEIVPATTQESELQHRIATGEINGYIIVPPDVLTSMAVVVTYKGDNGSNQAVGFELQRAVQQVALFARARAAGVTQAQLDTIQAEIVVLTLHTTGVGEASLGVTTFLLGYIIAFILYMVITLYGINVMRSVVTEKSSRVVELLVASVKPRALMAGKILGVGGAGLAQISLWFVIGGIALAYRDNLLSAFGAHAADASVLPSLSALQIAVIVVYFVLGYLFYSTMYAAIGATVASEQDAQQAQMPITMLLVIGMVTMSAVTGDPRGSTASTLTQVPFWSPMLMPLRYVLGGATLGEVAMSLGILLASIYVVARAAAKIYRVGILMYGKRPGLGELVRWLRY
jgi:ABC-2 type transport system permease protein